MNKYKELPITLDVDFSGNMMDCLPLCIVSAQEKLINWINQNFMMPIACMREDGLFEYIIADEISYGGKYKNPSAILRHSFIRSDILERVYNFSKVIKEQIEQDWYIVIFLDNYYLRETNSYKKQHNAHEVLIYGYDESKQIFKAIAYGTKMCKIEISYGEFEQAYAEVFKIIKQTLGWDEYMLILYQLIPHTTPYPFDQREFLRKLKMYLDGKISDRFFFEHFLYMEYERSECFYGLKANEAMLLKMSSIRKKFAEFADCQDKYGLFKQYFPIHVYWEFHKGLYKRMLAYTSLFPLKDNDTAIISEYWEIVDMCECIRMLYLKVLVLTEKKEDSRIVETLDRIVEFFEKIYLSEPEMIRKIFDIFTRNIKEPKCLLADYSK